MDKYTKGLIFSPKLIEIIVVCENDRELKETQKIILNLIGEKYPIKVGKLCLHTDEAMSWMKSNWAINTNSDMYRAYLFGALITGKKGEQGTGKKTELGKTSYGKGFQHYQEILNEKLYEKFFINFLGCLYDHTKDYGVSNPHLGKNDATGFICELTHAIKRTLPQDFKDDRIFEISVTDQQKLVKINSYLSLLGYLLTKKFSITDQSVTDKTVLGHLPYSG